jgi:hypothetical protein
VNENEPLNQPPTWGAPGAEPTVSSFPVGPSVPTAGPPVAGGPVMGGPPPAMYGAAEPVGSYVPAVPTNPKRRRGLMAGAIVGALALGAGGLAMAARSGSDGSATPQAAVQKLLASAEQSDMVGVMDSLTPGERELMLKPMLDTITELKRLEILAKKADPTKVDALVMTFTDEKFVEVPVNDRIKTVKMTAGTMTVKGDASKIPFGKLIEDLAGPDSLPKDISNETTDMDGTEITTVKVDGAWHVSLLYSIAELARKDQEAGPPSAANFVTPKGSDSPEAAVKDMVDALADLNARTVISLLPPDEYGVLQDYAYLFLDQADDARSQLPDDYKVTVDLPVRIVGSGSRRSAVPTGFKISGTADGESASAEYDSAGQCFKIEVSGDQQDFCQSDLKKFSDEAMDNMSPEMKQFSEDMNNMIDRTKLQDLGLTVRQVDGKWFVTPIGSYTDLMVAVMKSIKQPEFRALVTKIKEKGVEGFVGDLIGLGGDSFGGSLDGIGGLAGIDGLTQDDGFTIDGGDDGTFTEDSFPPIGDEPPSTDPFSVCSDAASTATDFEESYNECIKAAFDRGDVTADQLPLAVRFPECADALAVPLYSGGLSLDEIKAALSAQKLCLQPYIDAGDIETWALDGFMLHPECLDIANVYDFESDISDEAREKAYQCTLDGDLSTDTPSTEAPPTTASVGT